MDCLPPVSVRLVPPDVTPAFTDESPDESRERPTKTCLLQRARKTSKDMDYGDRLHHYTSGVWSLCMEILLAAGAAVSGGRRGYEGKSGGQFLRGRILRCLRRSLQAARWPPDRMSGWCCFDIRSFVAVSRGRCGHACSNNARLNEWCSDCVRWFYYKHRNNEFRTASARTYTSDSDQIFKRCLLSLIVVRVWHHHYAYHLA